MKTLIHIKYLNNKEYIFLFLIIIFFFQVYFDILDFVIPCFHFIEGPISIILGYILKFFKTQFFKVFV